MGTLTSRLVGCGAALLAVVGVYACAVGADTGDDGTGVGSADASLDGAVAYDGYGSSDDAGTGEEEEAGPREAGPADSGPSPDCDSPNNCNTGRATVPASISGDTSPANNAITTQGSSEEWIQVRATEDSHGVGGNAMTVKAVLTSPAGANYDLEMFVDNGSDTLSCTSPVETSSVPGSQSDQVLHEWGESGTFSNGSDDSRTVSFHITHASGPCGPGNEWTLVITGNP